MPDLPDEPSFESLRPVPDAGPSGSASSIRDSSPNRCLACGERISNRPAVQASQRSAGEASLGSQGPTIADALPYVVFLGIVLCGYAVWDLLRLISLVTESFGSIFEDSVGRRHLASIFISFAGCGLIALALANHCRQLWLRKIEAVPQGSTSMASAHDWLWTAIAIYALLKISLLLLMYVMLLPYLKFIG